MDRVRSCVSMGEIGLELEWVPCPVCGEVAFHPLHKEDGWQMVRCATCRFIYLNPRPTEEALFRFYQTYLPEGQPSVEDWKRMMGPVFKRAADLIERTKKGGRLLDVGAGFGFFLSEMKERGWDASGVELSQRAIDYARGVLGIDLQMGPLEKIGFKEDQFDVVSGFYVIEHLPRPMAFLREAHRILKPKGLLLLRYPHTTPIKDLLHRFHIPNCLYDLPAHLSDFSPEMIERCLKEAGFQGCKHTIGGFTLPKALGKRIASVVFGNVSEGLFCLSGQRYLLPGVSKTVLAYKG
ncbi:MAG: class I SAM-dependent methyltransferase [Desulfobacterota bacterium]|nr:class I SAM-dependent methyltransferase [Thermodesulfobacteriota bacterium]